MRHEGIQNAGEGGRWRGKGGGLRGGRGGAGCKLQLRCCCMPAHRRGKMPGDVTRGCRITGEGVGVGWGWGGWGVGGEAWVPRTEVLHVRSPMREDAR